jgi:hypothetical protein
MAQRSRNAGYFPPQSACITWEVYLIEEGPANADGDLETLCQGILLVDGPTNRGPSSPCT